MYRGVLFSSVFLPSKVAEQLASKAKYGWTPLHAAARGNAEAIGAVMTALVNYMEADEVGYSLHFFSVS